MDVTPPARPPGRPRLKEGPKKPPTRFRNVHVSFKKKQDGMDSFDEIGMAATLMKHFPHLRGPPLDTTRKKVYAWLKQRARIKVKATNPRTSKHLCSRELRMATTLAKESDVLIALWVHSMRKDGVPLTPQMIQIMALETAVDVGLDEKALVASWSWLESFKRRFWLSLRARTRQGQDTQGDGDAVMATFSAHVAQVVRDNDIDVIYNADPTGVNYEYLPTKTLNARGDNTVWIKCGGKSKDRATAQISTFKLQAPKRPTLVQWITDAWFGLSEAIITNGFAKCKIVHQDEAVDETVETTVPVYILSELVAISALDDNRWTFT
ncbi:hypothetical protein H257_12273 [Aphanomyces astaci]|uniref:HTH CENPB-type domain-containing protein n=1 Tax=Aphanomyces astaci TaxID=112090 RepID=W4FZN7_APHAT|nr:hypothetical protein H257_12273 [Aphanomyces astaci]ETV72942.1 hypothetical protein H257_12273 [Aphanomyces astaci]|eukprot:XP_009837728.1 hypothetical protein H257_12273 [Aphanomyces astaci]